MERFESRVALITGAASGIGLATARRHAFLASDDASFITGAILPVDAGSTAA